MIRNVFAQGGVAIDFDPTPDTAVLAVQWVSEILIPNAVGRTVKSEKYSFVKYSIHIGFCGYGFSDQKGREGPPSIHKLS